MSRVFELLAYAEKEGGEWIPCDGTFAVDGEDLKRAVTYVTKNTVTIPDCSFPCYDPNKRKVTAHSFILRHKHEILRWDCLKRIFTCYQSGAEEIIRKMPKPAVRKREEKEVHTSDGSSADYYKIPPGCTELQHLIAFKNMNAQMGEIFRATYRYGECSHSDRMREVKKILFYAEAEKERLEKYGTDS